MTYSEIIQNNIEKHSPVSWWPKFAFHYTDVTNAVSILDTGYLYSRLDATHLGIMSNDNASRQVIDMTNPSIVSKVRFYFRPLTPTQYYNEGYKHPRLRYDDDVNANTPVPVFFLFDLEKLLSTDGVQFSETSQAGHGSVLQSGIDAFSNLNFDLIYSNGYENISESKIYRHAEIAHNGSMRIEKNLRAILCRNSIERTTLLNLLKAKNRFAYEKYQNIIKVYNKNDLFENNGLFITECLFHDTTISILLSDNYSKHQYIKRMLLDGNADELDPIHSRIELVWKNSKRIIHHEEIKTLIDYAQTDRLSITKLPIVSGAREICITVFFDDKLMCCITQSIESDEVIK